MRTVRTIIAAVGVVTLLGLSACSDTDDAANDALEQAGVDGDVSTGGDLPADFPDDVATPDLPLETGVGLQGTYTLRYTSTDAVGDVTTYHAALEAAGFQVTPIIDNSADPAAGGNVAFTATNTEWSVVVSAFVPDAPGGGNYLAVVVTGL